MMKKQKSSYIGIREIARIAGVSTATVSRVINNPEQTSEKIREKVRCVINEYNYVPNQNAKNLFSKTSNSIAIFIYSLENPFFISLIKEINKLAFERKCTLLICNTENSKDREKEYLNYCEAIRTSGIILTEGLNYDIYFNKPLNQPVVFLDRNSNMHFPSVCSDSKKGLKLSVDYLYNLNHRRIAFVGANENFQSAMDRRDGYLEALKSHDIPINEQYIYNGNFDYKAGLNSLDYFCSLSEKPTAVICGNDQIAKGFITRASKLNIDIPDYFSVVGYDGVDSSDFLMKLTTIKQNVHKISETLLDLLKAGNRTPVVKTIDVTLKIGETCKKIDL